MAPVEDGSNSGGAPSEEAAPAEAEVELEDEFDLADLMAEETGCAAKSNADRLAEVDAQIQVLTPACTQWTQWSRLPMSAPTSRSAGSASASP